MGPGAETARGTAPPKCCPDLGNEKPTQAQHELAPGTCSRARVRVRSERGGSSSSSRHRSTDTSNWSGRYHHREDFEKGRLMARGGTGRERVLRASLDHAARITATYGKKGFSGIVSPEWTNCLLVAEPKDGKLRIERRVREVLP